MRRDSRVKDALKVGRDFVTRGARRLVELFKGRWSVERLFGRAKEWLLLGCLRLRGLEQVAIHAALSFMVMLAVAHAAVRCREPGLMRCIKHFGLRLVLNRLKEGDCVAVALCVWNEIGFID